MKPFNSVSSILTASIRKEYQNRYYLYDSVAYCQPTLELTLYLLRRGIWCRFLAFELRLISVTLTYFLTLWIRSLHIWVRQRANFLQCGTVALKRTTWHNLENLTISFLALAAPLKFTLHWLLQHESFRNTLSLLFLFCFLCGCLLRSWKSLHSSIVKSKIKSSAVHAKLVQFDHTLLFFSCMKI